MADVQARREARRKKILANTENRLKFITGEHNGIINETATICNNIHDDEQISQETDSTICEEDILRVANHFPPETFINSYIRNEFAPVTNNEHSIGQPTDNDKKTSKSSNNFRSYIVGLAILTRILYEFFDFSLFLPFLLIETTIIFSRKKSGSSAFFNTILMFSNFPPKQVRFVSRLLNIVEHIVKDFSLYFFTLVIFNLGLELVF